MSEANRLKQADGTNPAGPASEANEWATRTQVTEALIGRMDQVVASRKDLEGRLPQDMYAALRQDLMHAWHITLADPVARRQVQLDKRWSVSKREDETMITLLEVLLDLCAWSQTRLGVDDACSADLLDNLRRHPFRTHDDDNEEEEEKDNDNTRNLRAISWYSTEKHRRHGLVYLCQEVLQYATMDEDATDIAFAYFVLEVLTYVLVRAQDLRVHCVFYTLARSNSERLLTLSVALVHRYALTIDERGESLAHVMLFCARPHILDKWASTPAWVDQALHSDWDQPSHRSGNTVEECQQLLPANNVRSVHIAALKQRWATHVKPAIRAALAIHLPITDLVQYIVMPCLGM
jgi:hypothetical protein